MKKVLIANRGEIACRIMRSCQQLGIATVAVYSSADEQALHVQMADEAYHIGAAKASESYLLVDRIVDAAIASGADAVHPGYGFLAENADFAQTLKVKGIQWIGPTPKSIQDMGDKERARLIAERSGVPVLPGSRRFAVGDTDALQEAAQAVGYPLLVKASAGGGGIGMRRVDSPEKLLEVVQATQKLAQRSFGDGTVFLERFVARARHIEIQVFGFGDGRVVHFYERECSIQRRFQKIIEESPAPGLPENVRQCMAEAALDLARAQNYEGAGTVEFVVDAETLEFYFLEMNTRIQVEHPVTEMVTGVDLVTMQIQLALGEKFADFSQQQIRPQGHAIECRIYAEDPSRMFLPTPGTIETFAVGLVNSENAIRLDTGVRSGDKITAYYDPMIAKLICHGADRTQAIEKCLATIASTELTGIKHNLSFLTKTLQHSEFQSGRLFTGFIEQHQHTLI